MRARVRIIEGIPFVVVILIAACSDSQNVVGSDAGNNMTDNGSDTEGDGDTDTDTDTDSSTEIVSPCIVYVRGNLTDFTDHDGSSWADAFEHIQEGIDAAAARVDDAGDTSCEVWVAAGIYLPTMETAEGDPRTKTIQLRSGVALYGGFEGGETALEERVFAIHLTTLSGDIGSPGNNSDNVYHVVTGADDAIIDGFTITGGNADGAVIINSNSGGGMYNYTDVSVVGCTFSSNSAGDGGGMYNATASSSVVTNCSFFDNAAGESGYGGGIEMLGSRDLVINCIFSGNSAASGGGISLLGGASPTVTNCTFFANSADSGGGIFIDLLVLSMTLTNSILWDSIPDEIYDDSSVATVTYCDIGQKEYAGKDNNININPKFIEDLHLQRNLAPGSGSPCIDAGNSKAIPDDILDLDSDSDTDEPIPYDRDGEPRMQGGEVDMGAFEDQ